MTKVRTELKLRINRGYETINLEFVEEFVEKALKSMDIEQ